MFNLKKIFSFVVFSSMVVSFEPCAYAMDLVAKEIPKSIGTTQPSLPQDEKKDLPKKVYSFSKGQPLMTVYSASMSLGEPNFEASSYSYIPTRETMTFDEVFEEISQQYLKNRPLYCLGCRKVTSLGLIREKMALDDSNFSKYLEGDYFKKNKVLIFIDPYSHPRYKKD